MTEVESLITADELGRLSFPDKQVELVRGVLVVREPPSGWHGMVTNRLAYRVTAFVQEHRLGVVFAQDTGFKIASDPDTVRGPDLAFVARERAGAIRRRGYPELAPDLVAEILAPGDRPGEVLAKVAEWGRGPARLGTGPPPDRGSGLPARRQPHAPGPRRSPRRRGRAPRVPLPARRPPGVAARSVHRSAVAVMPRRSGRKWCIAPRVDPEPRDRADPPSCRARSATGAPPRETGPDVFDW